MNIDELLAKAEGKKAKPLRIENNHNTLNYIKAVGWEPGLCMVPTYVIFWHYRMVYEGTHNDHKANKITFFRTFSKRFPAVRKNKQRFYLLNDIIPLTEETLEKAMIYEKNYGQRKKKKVRFSGQEGNDKN